jgi:hypothetical protein
MATFPVLNLVRHRKVYKSRKTIETDYKRLFRFEESNVIWMAHHFLGVYVEKRGAAINSKRKMEIFLRYISDPGFQTGVGEDLGVDQTTVCKIVQSVRQTKHI